MPLLIVVASAFQSLCNYAAVYLNTWVGQKITSDLKTDMYKKLMQEDTTFLTSLLPVWFRCVLIMTPIWRAAVCWQI